MSNEGDAIKGIQNMDPKVRDALARIVESDAFYNRKALTDDVLLDVKSKSAYATEMTTDEKDRAERGVGRFVMVDVHNNVEAFLKNPALKNDLGTILQLKSQELDGLLKAEMSHESVANHHNHHKIEVAAQKTVDAAIAPLPTPGTHPSAANKQKSSRAGL